MSVDSNFGFEEEVYDFPQGNINTNDILQKRQKTEENRKLQSDYVNTFAKLKAAAEDLAQTYIPVMSLFNIKDAFKGFAARDTSSLKPLLDTLASLEAAVSKAVNDDKNKSPQYKAITHLDTKQVKDFVSAATEEVQHFNTSSVSDFNTISYRGYDANGNGESKTRVITEIPSFKTIAQKLQSEASSVAVPGFYSQLRAALNLETNKDVEAFLVDLNKKIKTFKTLYSEAYKLDTRTQAEKQGGLEGDTRSTSEKLFSGDFKEAARDAGNAFSKTFADGVEYVGEQLSQTKDYILGNKRYDPNNPTVKPMESTSTAVSTDVADLSQAVPLDSPEFTRAIHTFYQSDIEYGMGYMKLQCYKLLANAQKMEQQSCALDFQKESGSSSCISWKAQVENGLNNCAYIFPMNIGSVDPQIQILLENSASNLAVISESGIQHIVAGEHIGTTSQTDKSDFRDVADTLTYNPLLSGAAENIMPMLGSGASTTIHSSGNMLPAPECSGECPDYQPL